MGNTSSVGTTGSARYCRGTLDDSVKARLRFELPPVLAEADSMAGRDNTLTATHAFRSNSSTWADLPVFLLWSSAHLAECATFRCLHDHETTPYAHAQRREIASNGLSVSSDGQRNERALRMAPFTEAGRAAGDQLTGAGTPPWTHAPSLT